MVKEIIQPPNVFDSMKKWGYHQAIKAGNTIYLAGQVALDENEEVVGKGDFEVQHRQCLENIKRILEAAGAKMSDIVWILWFLTDMREGSKLRTLPAYREYFGDNNPPGTCVQISNLGTPELLLEVQVIAVIDD